MFESKNSNAIPEQEDSRCGSRGFEDREDR